MATFRSRPAERWLSCYVGRTSRLACWNPTAWCAAGRNDCCGIETIRLLTGRAMQGATLTGSLPHRNGRATRGLRIVQVPPCGANPDRLEPIITTPGALGQPPATGLQIGTLGELSAAGMEPHASCARANVTRTHTHAQAHTHAHTRAPYAHTRTHAHTRAHARAK